MARIRTIVPEFWEDERSADVSLPALLLYIGMKNFATDDGVITDNPLILRSKVFPAREDIRRQQVSLWLQELIENSFLVPLSYEGKGYYVLDFSSERIDKPKRSNIPQEVIDEAIESSEVRIATRTSTEECIPPESTDNPANSATCRDKSRIVATSRERSRKVENSRESSRTFLLERKGKDMDNGEEGDAPASVREEPATDDDFKKFMDWIDANAPSVNKLKEPFTRKQYERVRKDFPSEIIVNTLLSMHNYKELLQKYVSANLTFRKWAKRDMEHEERANNTATYAHRCRGQGASTAVSDDYKRSILARLRSGGGAAEMPGS